MRPRLPLANWWKRCARDQVLENGAAQHRVRAEPLAPVRSWGTHDPGERGEHPSQAASSPATVTWPAATCTVLILEKVLGLQLPLRCTGLLSTADSAVLGLVVYFLIKRVLRVYQVSSFLFRSEDVLLSSPRRLSLIKTFASCCNRF